jgi:cell division protein FtsB
MTDDLIRRLRDLVVAVHDDLSVGDEAADEIERLRAENAALRTEINRLCPSSWDENARAWAEELRRK